MLIVGWLYQYVNQVDCDNLADYFNKCLSYVLKEKVEVSFTVKNIFTGKSEDNTKNKEFNLNKAK